MIRRFPNVVGFDDGSFTRDHRGNVPDAWRAALRLPNVIRNLLGEGSLSASVIPVYSELIEEGREEDAGRFAGAILGILTVVAGSIALLGVLVAPWIVRIVCWVEPSSPRALRAALIWLESAESETIRLPQISAKISSRVTVRSAFFAR